MGFQVAQPRDIPALGVLPALAIRVVRFARLTSVIRYMCFKRCFSFLFFCSVELFEVPT